jgi:hypothetical protein
MQLKDMREEGPALSARNLTSQSRRRMGWCREEAMRRAAGASLSGAGLITLAGYGFGQPTHSRNLLVELASGLPLVASLAAVVAIEAKLLRHTLLYRRMGFSELRIASPAHHHQKLAAYKSQVPYQQIHSPVNASRHNVDSRTRSELRSSHPRR